MEIKGPIGEIKGGFDPVSVDPAIAKIAGYLPEHDASEHDAKQYQGGIVDRAEQVAELFPAPNFSNLSFE